MQEERDSEETLRICNKLGNPSIRDNDHCAGTHKTIPRPVRRPSPLGEGAELRRKPRLHLPGSFHRKTRPGRANNSGLATLNNSSRLWDTGMLARALVFGVTQDRGIVTWCVRVP